MSRWAKELNRVYVSLGSNIEPERNLREAVRLLASCCKLVAVSPVYQTKAVGKTDQPDFLNAAALIETELGLKMNLALLFRAPTPAQLAASLGKME